MRNFRFSSRGCLANVLARGHNKRMTPAIIYCVRGDNAKIMIDAYICQYHQDLVHYNVLLICIFKRVFLSEKKTIFCIKVGCMPRVNEIHVALSVSTYIIFFFLHQYLIIRELIYDMMQKCCKQATDMWIKFAMF